MSDEFKQAYKDLWKTHDADWISWCGHWMLYDGDIFCVR